MKEMMLLWLLLGRRRMIQTQYDIYYQKFDQQGNKLGEALIV